MKLSKEQISENISSKKIVEVPLSVISNININPRKSGLIMENVESLIESQGDFPEIYLALYENQLIIIDGWHRFTASQKLNLETINAFIIAFDSFDEMKKEAFKANLNHGIKLTDLDVAMNLYEFYNESQQKNPLTSFTDVIESCGLKKRRGRCLFLFAAINKEILETVPNNSVNYSFYEEYYKLVKGENEVFGNISTEFKIKFKMFFNKYNQLTKSQLREAISLYFEGKDYFEEKERKRIEEENNSKSLNIIEQNDLINNDSCNKSSEDDNKSREENPIIKNINETYNNLHSSSKELIKDIQDQDTDKVAENYEVSSKEYHQEDNGSTGYTPKEMEEIDENKFGSNDSEEESKKPRMKSHIKNLKEITTKMKLLTLKDKVTISKEDYLEIKNIINSLSEVVIYYTKKESL